MALDQSVRRGVVTVVLGAVAVTAILTILAAFVGVNMLGFIVWQSWVAAVGAQKAAAFVGMIASGGISLGILGLIYWYASQKPPEASETADA